MDAKSLTVFAPASIGNLSVGFDALGLALSPVDGTLLGDIVELRSGKPGDWRLEVAGPFADQLPEEPEQNVVMASCRRFERESQKEGVGVVPLYVKLKSACRSAVAWVPARVPSLQPWWRSTSFSGGR